MSNPNSWSTDESRRALLRDAETGVKRTFKSVWSGFTSFALRDNVLEIAVGLIIATTFTAVVNSLMSDIILPPLSLLPFMSRNMEEKFMILRKGSHFKDLGGYNTRNQAIEDGAVILTYGAFIDELVNFIGIGLTLYALATIYGHLSHESIIKNTVKCPYCRKEISEKAKRCPMCTSWLDGREEKETSALSSQAN